jgi:hypothetical protein
MNAQDKLIKLLYQEWPATFDLQPKTAKERHDVIAIQLLKMKAAKEIERLQKLISDHNADCGCHRETCGYANYPQRRCPECPVYWLIYDKEEQI